MSAISYRANGLGDIAAEFRRLGFDAVRRAGLTTAQRKVNLETEARTWQRAAEIVEATTLNQEPSQIAATMLAALERMAADLREQEKTGLSNRMRIQQALDIETAIAAARAAGIPGGEAS